MEDMVKSLFEPLPLARARQTEDEDEDELFGYTPVVIELRITWSYFGIDTSRRHEVKWNLALEHGKDLWKSIAELYLGHQEHFQS